ncbi:MAG: NlpC/P60 family protein [Coriobacteriales bacterium]|nr:NlpC/P60 family protein [Coriobacteriales bacterium]
MASVLTVSGIPVAHADEAEIQQNIEQLSQEEQAARDAQAALEQQAAAAQAQQVALEQQVKEAQEKLNALMWEAEQCENELITITNQLNDTIARIAELDKQIADAQAELERTQEELADIVVDNYKNGRPTILSIIFSAKDFDDLLSRITYANKVSEHETSVISNIKQLQEQLANDRAQREQEKATQEEQKALQEERMAALEQAVAEVDAYRAQLSAEVVAKMNEAAEAQRQAAEQAARAEQAATQRAAEEDALRQAQEARRRAEEEAARQAAEEAARQNAAAAGTSSNDDSDSGGSYTPASAGDVASFVNAAYSIIGSGYSWSGYYWTGSTSTSWFTCSGVIDFALGRAPRSSSPETLYAEVGSRKVYSTSELNYGDLVFYACLGRYPGHVGIYIGNGNIIDAISNGGVAIRNVGYLDFIGGGPIL